MDSRNINTLSRGQILFSACFLSCEYKPVSIFVQITSFDFDNARKMMKTKCTVLPVSDKEPRCVISAIACSERLVGILSIIKTTKEKKYIEDKGIWWGKDVAGIDLFDGNSE